MTFMNFAGASSKINSSKITKFCHRAMNVWLGNLLLNKASLCSLQTFSVWLEKIVVNSFKNEEKKWKKKYLELKN